MAYDGAYDVYKSVSMIRCKKILNEITLTGRHTRVT